MSATTRFYLGFCIALAVVIGVAFFIGYRAGAGHELHVIHALPRASASARATQAP